MLFNLDEGNGTWFDFQESTVDAEGVITFLPVKEGAGSVCVRQADADFFEKLNKKTRKKDVRFIPNPARNNTLQRVEDSVVLDGKDKEEREALQDHWIVDFKDLRGADKQLIACTKENKIKLMKLGVFRRFIDECHRRISSDGGMIKEENENL